MEKNQTEKLVTNVSSDVLTDERNCCGGVQSGECSEAHDEASEINGVVDEETIGGPLCAPHPGERTVQTVAIPIHDKSE